MEKQEAIKERTKLQKLLKTQDEKSVRYNIERRIGDLNQFIINK